MVSMINGINGIGSDLEDLLQQWKEQAEIRTFLGNHLGFFEEVTSPLQKTVISFCTQDDNFSLKG